MRNFILKIECFRCRFCLLLDGHNQLLYLLECLKAIVLETYSESLRLWSDCDTSREENRQISKVSRNLIFADEQFSDKISIQIPVIFFVIPGLWQLKKREKKNQISRILALN